MIAWLEKKKIDFPQFWKQKRGYKKEIWALVKQIKEETPDFNAEQLARKYGHFILRLPPYHCELYVLTFCKILEFYDMLARTIRFIFTFKELIQCS